MAKTGEQLVKEMRESGKAYLKKKSKKSSRSSKSSKKIIPVKTEQQFIEETRAAGKAYLEKTPEAFGGGIDPKTGIRYKSGKRVSVEPVVSKSKKTVYSDGLGYSVAPELQEKFVNDIESKKIKPTVVQDVKSKYGRIESAASKKLYDITGFSEEKDIAQRKAILESEEFLKRRAKESSQFLISKGIPLPIVKGGEFISNIGIGAGTMISGFTGTLGKKTIDKPITTTGKYAAYGAAGYGAGLAAGGASSIFASTGAIGSTLGAISVPAIRIGGTALTGYYAVSKGKEIISAPTSFERGGIIGESILETGAIGSGFVSGKVGSAKIGDIWRTRGRKEIPVEDIVIPEVLSGKKTFVESKSYGFKGIEGKAKQQFDIGVFEKKPTAFHTTEKQFWKSGFETRPTAPRPGDLPGTYVAPSVSTQFARVTGDKAYKLSLFGKDVKTPQPAVAEIFTKFTTDPKSKTGAAFVRGAKPEIEAIIPPGQQFAKVSGETFFKLGGRRIPIDVFKPIGVKPTGSGVSKFFPSGYSSYKTPTYSLFTPTSLGVSSLISTSSTANIPSYTPTSYTPTSYTPTSYTPTSYTPSKYVTTSAPTSYSPTSYTPSKYTTTSAPTSYTPSKYVTTGAPTSYAPTSYTTRKQPPLIPLFSLSPGGMQIAKKQQAYIPQAKSQGGKWVTLSNKPMNRQSALSRASRASDQTLSAQFRIKKTKGKIKDNGDNYFGMTKNKYRPYKIKKGKKIELHNQFIEKRGRRIDTSGEKKGLKLSKYVKQQGWLSKKKNKTKSPWLI